MPPWSIHQKWAERLGISEDISMEIDELIDFPKQWFEYHYAGLTEDNALSLLSENPEDTCLKLFLISDTLGHDWGRKRKFELYSQLDCVYSFYGIEGVKAVFLHHILDYISTTNFDKEETLRRISRKLRGSDFDYVLDDVLEFVALHWDAIVRDTGRRSYRRQEPPDIHKIIMEVLKDFKRLQKR